MRLITKKLILFLFGAILIISAINSYWLAPLLRSKSVISKTIDSFGPSQLHAFMSVGTVAHNVPLSTLLLEGFWADPQGRYVLPSSLGVWWYFVVGAIGSLIMYGAYHAVKRGDKMGIALITSGILAWWLAMGIANSWSAGTTLWLIQHVPFYRGYREPQKWLMVLVLGYSYLAAIGLSEILRRINNLNMRAGVLICGLLLGIMTTPILLFGAGGQLVSAEYPSDWTEAEQTLNKDSSRYKVLVLPWHEYLPISFTKRVVANPAPDYFKQNMIVSDNPEIAGVPPTESSPLYRLLDNQLLPERNFRTDAAKQLAPYHVKYVLLLKEADWNNYGWLNKQKNFILIQNTAHIELYKIAGNK